ncbi:MAG: hypothetical protein A2512_13135 [Deltaproteobacteria bacterium RIFOXYD12_FULL_56_24]|nr:MAG: hypothetical protein A2512_13135 [Deltaproteobacteria bacterium RIFOXYD12_FULL_56_24]
MHTILNRIDRLMMAITFAEANESELARECLGNQKPKQNKQAEQTIRIPDGQILPNQTTH